MDSTDVYYGSETPVVGPVGLLPADGEDGFDLGYCVGTSANSILYDDTALPSLHSQVTRERPWSGESLVQPVSFWPSRGVGAAEAPRVYQGGIFEDSVFTKQDDSMSCLTDSTGSLQSQDSEAAVEAPDAPAIFSALSVPPLSNETPSGVGHHEEYSMSAMYAEGDTPDDSVASGGFWSLSSSDDQDDAAANDATSNGTDLSNSVIDLLRELPWSVLWRCYDDLTETTIRLLKLRISPAAAEAAMRQSAALCYPDLADIFTERFFVRVARNEMCILQLRAVRLRVQRYYDNMSRVFTTEERFKWSILFRCRLRRVPISCFVLRNPEQTERTWAEDDVILAKLAERNLTRLMDDELAELGNDGTRRTNTSNVITAYRVAVARRFLIGASVYEVAEMVCVAEKSLYRVIRSNPILSAAFDMSKHHRKLLKSYCAVAKQEMRPLVVGTVAFANTQGALITAPEFDSVESEDTKNVSESRSKRYERRQAKIFDSSLPRSRVAENKRQRVKAAMSRAKKPLDVPALAPVSSLAPANSLGRQLLTPDFSSLLPK